MASKLMKKAPPKKVPGYAKTSAPKSGGKKMDMAAKGKPMKKGGKSMEDMEC